MPNLLPHLIDMPMALGDHLEELRRRLIVPVIAFVLLFIVGFAFWGDLMLVMIEPLRRAVALVPEQARHFHLDPESPRLLQAIGLSESLVLSVKISAAAALAATIPIFVYQLWMFVSIGLKRPERSLGFLFIPAAVLFFYGGIVLGYFYGLPYFYAWMIAFSAMNPALHALDLRLETYWEDFLAWTVCFGLIMDIPWLVMVLVRVGLVTREWLAAKRKFIVLINVVAAAVITPGGDVTMLIATLVPMQLLFEIGLFFSRFLMPRRVAEDDPL